MTKVKRPKFHGRVVARDNVFGIKDTANLSGLQVKNITKRKPF